MKRNTLLFSDAALQALGDREFGGLVIDTRLAAWTDSGRDGPIFAPEFADRLAQLQRHAELRRNPRQKVYFIRAGKAVKIGIAHDPRRRLNGLQTARHERLELLATIDGGRELEAALHNRFSKYAIRGEWFHYKGWLARFIKQCAERGEPG